MSTCRWCKRNITQHRITGTWVNITNAAWCISQWGRHPHLPESTP